MSAERNSPNPGSAEAVANGCTCPVIDNHYGLGVLGRDGDPMFWRDAECPLHGEPTFGKESQP